MMSPLRNLNTLVSLYGTGLLDKEEKKRAFPYYSYLTCKPQAPKQVRSVPPHIRKRFLTLTQVAPSIEDSTLETVYLCADSPEKAVESLQSIAHLSKQESLRVRRVLDRVKAHTPMASVSSLYSVPSKNVTCVTMRNAMIARKAFVHKTAMAMISKRAKGVHDTYERLQLLNNSGMSTFVKKTCDLLQAWCRRSIGLTSLLCHESKGKLVLAPKERFLALLKDGNRPGCEPMRSSLVTASSIQANANRRLVNAIPRGARSPTTQKPPAAPKNTRPAKVRYAVKDRSMTMFLTRPNETRSLFESAGSTLRKAAAERKPAKKASKKQRALKALDTPPANKKKSPKYANSNSNNENGWEEARNDE